MEKDQEKRLQNGEEVKRHSFFSKLSFDEIEQQNTLAPFIPLVVSK